MTSFHASFRLMGRDLDPSAVSETLGLEPDQAHRRGDANVGRSGRRFSDFSEGLWALNSRAGDEAPLTAHMEDLLRRLAGREVAVRKLLTSGLRGDFFIGVFGEGSGQLGVLVPPDIMRRVAALGVPLDFDVYD